MSPWFIKHKPTKFTELVFSNDVHFKCLNWIKNCSENNKIFGKILHISGPSGTGKSILAVLASKAFNYNPIEIDYEILSSIYDYMKKPNNTINGKKNILIVDETAINKNLSIINSFKFSKIPIIITSTELYFKEIETIKITKPTLENVLQVVNGILKKEKKILDQQFIIKVASYCNMDIRSTINNIELLSDNKIDLIEKNIIYGNIFNQCQNIFNKRYRVKELENLYSTKIAEMCLNSAIDNLKDIDALRKILTGFSDSDSVYFEYEFLSLVHLNEYNGNFVYSKVEIPEVFTRSLNKCPVKYLDQYSRNIKSEKLIKHLQEIFKEYNIENLSKEDLEIKNMKHFKPIIEKEFSYNFVHGSSTAIKRDISLKELLDFN